jgi:hypothetical protein
MTVRNYAATKALAAVCGGTFLTCRSGTITQHVENVLPQLLLICAII